MPANPDEENTPVDPAAVPVSPANLAELGIKGLGETRDYTAERARRVLPIVKNLISGMGTFQLTVAAKGQDKEKEEQSFDDFYSHFITQAMTTDLRIKDVDYTFQLTKLAIEMLHTQFAAKGAETATRLLPVAQDIYQQLAEVENLMLDVQEDEPAYMGENRAALYARLVEDIIIPTFAKYSVATYEVEEVFAYLKVLIYQIEQRTTITLDSASRMAGAKLWGIDDVDDLTVRAIHEKCLEKTDQA